MKKALPLKFQMTLMFLVSIATSIIVLGGFVYYLENKTELFKTPEEVSADIDSAIKRYIAEVIEKQASNGQESELKKSTIVPKKAKPQVELFVMSHCPFGTQIEKGILPPLYLLADKIDFELKFVDYAMHPADELKEQLTQYCIQEKTDKLLDYLSCYLEDGNSSRCLEAINIDGQMIELCEKEADQKYKISESFANRALWNGRYPPFDTHKIDNIKYEIKGSPTLVINGAVVETNRDSASLLEVICSGFDNRPEECLKDLPTAIPSPGFGYGNSTNTLDLDCIQ